ncbi:MAG: hypothetical protein ACTTKX_03695 [Treponema sp.]
MARGKTMLTTLKAIEKGNLYASFGLVEDLSDDELMDTEGCGCSWEAGPGGAPCANVKITLGGRSSKNSDAKHSGSSSSSSNSFTSSTSSNGGRNRSGS